ncbi:MAG: MogA/MoaB family molybdenum cofactor biosynthesis protein [Methanobacteriaceae archaeon]|nr:MogA/MoaB family molybdenum cofactor biosynthesis protein [Methanobacteriaceae archaeon]
MSSKSMERHRKNSPSTIKVGILTLSDSKYQDSLKSINTDVSGDIIEKSLTEKGHLVVRDIIPDEAKDLLKKIHQLIEKEDVDIIISTGGTGIGSRDITIETLQKIFEKELYGFGEIFRHKSYQELGSGAILSRATAGVYKRKLIIALPGSPNAVKTGLEIVINELGHLVKHLNE